MRWRWKVLIASRGDSHIQAFIAPVLAGTARQQGQFPHSGFTAPALARTARQQGQFPHSGFTAPALARTARQ